MDNPGTATRVARGDDRLETQRLVLRKPREGDLEDMLEIFLLRHDWRGGK